MADENSQTSSASAASVAAPTPPAPVEVDPREAALTWLNSAPAEEILRINRVGGIVGQRLQNERERVRQEIEKEHADKARIEAEAELDRLANEDPVEFSRRFLSDKEQKRIKDQEQNLRQDVRKEFATRIGQTFQQLAEWQEITPEEYQRLASSLEGKSDEEAIGVFVVTAADIVAERKSNKKLAKFKETELAGEREALRAEEAQKLLSKSPAPDIARGSSASRTFDPTKLSDKDFEKFYRETFLGRQ